MNTVHASVFDSQPQGYDMRVAVGLVVCLMLAALPPAAAQYDPIQTPMWPGEPIDSHVHMTWAALTLEVNDWADENPDIVDLSLIHI